MQHRIKKYWWILFLIILTPCVINYIMIQPQICEITGNDTSWLSFWGGYIGSIISSSIAVFILCKQLNQNHQENENNRKQNHKENEGNRKLQLAIVKHEQEKVRLSQLKNAFTDFILSCNDNAINKVVSNMMSKKYSLTDYDNLRNLWDDMSKKKFIIDLNIKNLPKTEFLNNYILAFDALYKSYVSTISNLEFFNMIMSNLPEDKKKYKTYVTEFLDSIERKDSEDSKKTDGLVSPKSIASIIKNKGCYDEIEENAPTLIGCFIIQFYKENNLKQKFESTIMDLVISEEKRIDGELYI